MFASIERGEQLDNSVMVLGYWARWAHTWAKQVFVPTRK
jgi:hypothetical protein